MSCLRLDLNRVPTERAPRRPVAGGDDWLVAVMPMSYPTGAISGSRGCPLLGGHGSPRPLEIGQPGW